jgi:hypothetical protein
MGTTRLVLGATSVAHGVLERLSSFYYSFIDFVLDVLEVGSLSGINIHCPFVPYDVDFPNGHSSLMEHSTRNVLANCFS